MRRTRDTRVKGAHDSSNSMFQFHVHAFSSDISARGDAQSALDGAHVVHRGNDKLGVGDQAVFDDVMVDQRPARSLDQAIRLAIPRPIADVSVLPVERLMQYLDRRRFTLDQAQIVVSADGLSPHDAGLAETLALARAIGKQMPEMVIFGVQPANQDWGQGLGPEVEAVLSDLVDAIQDEIDTFVTSDA